MNLRLNIPELVFTMVTAIAFGVFFWGWTFLDGLIAPFLATFGFKFLLSGFWLISCVFAPFVIRKPGVAVLASVVAAAVEGILTRWGLAAVLWGLAQGLGAELVFACLGYRFRGYFVLYLGSLGAAAGGYALSYVHSSYDLLAPTFNLLQFSVALFSSLVFSAYFAQLLIKRLLPTGLLVQFAIDKK